MTKKIVTRFLLPLLTAVIVVLALPLISYADYSAYQADSCPVPDAYSEAGKYYYHSADDNFISVPTSTVRRWRAVDYMAVGTAEENEAVFTQIGHDVRTAMLNRESTMEFIVATNKDIYNSSIALILYGQTYIENDFADYVYGEADGHWFDTADLGAADKARAGDYLYWSLKSDPSIESGDCKWMDASAYSPYSYYKITLTFEYYTTYAEEEQIRQFMDRWQQSFITDNTTLAGISDFDDKKYFIVKSIYNFLTENTEYDNDTRLGKTSVSSDRYRYSHSAYGALFGNMSAKAPADNPFEHFTFDIREDSLGLSRSLITTSANKVSYQGLAVCQGYAMVSYYLCQLNGIDCRIVDGDYTAEVISSGSKKSDPHAWNVITLEGSKYYFDATYSAQSNLKVFYNSLFRSFVDYSYLLRGRSNASFGASKHQQQTQITDVSAADYQFENTSYYYDADESWIVVTRRLVDNLNNLSGRYVQSPDGTKYKYDMKGSFVQNAEPFTYDGNQYTYYVDPADLANGVEFNTPKAKLKDKINKSFKVKAVDGSTIQDVTVSIAALDMSKPSSYGKVEWNSSDITSLTNTTQSINFTGSTLDLKLTIGDCSGRQLAKDTDYQLVYYNKSNNTTVKPINPGEYYMLLNFDIDSSSNYKGKLKIYFDIVKTPISDIVEDSTVYSALYGCDITPNIGSVKCKSSNIVFTSGKDYKFTLNNDYYLSAGKIGSFTFTALSGSQYLKAGTKVTFYYKVSARDLSSLSGGSFTSYAPDAYTGQPVKLSKSTIKLSNGSVLSQGTDYTVTGYKNNVAAGTATATIKFKGNYSGTASASFKIVKKSGGAGGTTITVNKISGLKATPGANGVSLSWSSLGAHYSYQIEMYDTAAKKWTLLGQQGGTSFNSTFAVSSGKQAKFTSGGTYQYRVRGMVCATINGKTDTFYGNYATVNATMPLTAPKLKVTAKKKSFTANWDKNASLNGYELQYSTAKNFKGAKTVKIKKGSTATSTVKKLKGGKTYYVRIRSYKTVNGKTNYSPYSATASVKVKK